LLNREVNVQDAADSREDGVIKIAQHALDLRLGRSIGVEIARIEKMSLASAKRLQLLGAKIVNHPELYRLSYSMSDPTPFPWNQ
jgi:hypothetical protein